MKRISVLVATVSLVAGGVLVAAAPAGAGPGAPPSVTEGLVLCDAAPFGESGIDSVGAQVDTPLFSDVYCAQLTVEKDVDGDDPGVAFPIDVTCETVGSGAIFTANEILDPGDAGDDPVAETEWLADGESETFEIPVVTVWSTANPGIVGIFYRIVDCEVSEDVGDADLPSGWVCDLTDIDPDDDVTFGPIGADPEQSATIVVTNDCEEPPATTTTTTTTTTAPAPAAPPAAAAAAVVAAPRVTG